MRENAGNHSGFSPESLWLRLLSSAEEKGADLAVAWSDGRISFEQLIPLVAARGAQLTSLELERNGFLPIIVDYTLESVVDVLACLCFRIPFAPLDPDSPPPRMRQLWKLLGEPTHFLAPSDVPKELLPEMTERISKAPKKLDSPHPRFVTGGDDGLAILTSGSTGHPKGVVFSFQVLDERVLEAIEAHIPQPGHGVVTSFSPLHFIGGFRQIAQVFSGRALLRRDPKTLHPRALLDWLAEENPTHLNIPAQLMRILGPVASSSKTKLPRVVQVNVGAEAVRYEWLHGIKSLLPRDVRIRHSLGSTEAAASFVNNFDLHEAPDTGRVPIGQPQTDGTLRLEPWHEDLPHVLEVWRSGPIASRYLGDTLLNNERFQRDKRGILWWKSGDLVELSSDGQYFHHSRTDDVTKIRGKLASPSEAASAIMNLEGTGRAIVLAEISAGQTILVAHVEKRAGLEITGAEIRRRLESVLPSHLIPSRIKIHNQLPVNQRGKVDRNALSSDQEGK